jgi:hypothetical protein
LQSPRFFESGGKKHAAYELLLTNTGNTPLTVERLVVHDPVPHSLQGKKLASSLVQLVPDEHRVSGLRQQKHSKSLIIHPKEKHVIFLWSSLDRSVQPPKTIHIDLFLTGIAEALHHEVAIETKQPVALRPPVDGPGWFSFLAPNNRGSHRRSIHQIEGTLFLSQRFAVDLVRTNTQGKRFSGSPDTNESYLAYGTPVVAVGTGIVRQIQTDVPDNNPGGCVERVKRSTPCKVATAVPITQKTLAGNYILLELETGETAVYAHLIPNSILVHVGDKVPIGQPLAKVGNSGNTTEPHLHFHLCDRVSVTACAGIPYHFKQFIEIPIDPRRGPIGPPRLVNNQMVANSSVLHFPDKNGNLPKQK